MLASAYLHCREGDGLLVNYSELPEAMAGRLAKFFRLNVEQRQQVLAATMQHAKQPSQRFVADGEDKRREASPWLRERVRQCAQDAFLNLELLRNA